MSKLLPVMCAALAVAACVTPPPPTQPIAKAEKPPAGCVAQVATRVPVTSTQCAGFGAAYTDKDLQNTGRPYANQALSQLDPSVQLTGR